LRVGGVAGALQFVAVLVGIQTVVNGVLVTLAGLQAVGVVTQAIFQAGVGTEGRTFFHGHATAEFMGEDVLALTTPALVGFNAKEIVAVTALFVGNHVFAPAGFQRCLGDNGAGVNAQFGANGLGVRVHSGNEIGRSGKLLPFAAVTAGDIGRCCRAVYRFR